MPSAQKRTSHSRNISQAEPTLDTFQKRYALNNKEFAAILGISRSTLQKWRSGEASPPPHLVKLLRMIDTLADGDSRICSSLLTDPAEILATFAAAIESGSSGRLPSMDRLTLQKGLLKARQSTDLAIRQTAIYFNNSEEAWLRCLPDTTLLEVNDAFCRLSGYPREFLLGRKWLTLSSDGSERRLINDSVDQVLIARQARGFRVESQDRHGAVRHMRWRLVPTVSGDAAAFELYGIGHDITEEILNQKKALQAEVTLQAVLQADPAPVWIVNRNGTIRHLSRSGEALAEQLRISPGSALQDLFDEQAGQRLAEELQALKSGQVIEFRGAIKTPVANLQPTLTARIAALSWMAEEAFLISFGRQMDMPPGAERLEDFRLQTERYFLSTLTIARRGPASHAIIHQMLEFLGYLLNASRTCVSLYDGKKRTVSMTQEWCAAAVAPQTSALQEVPLRQTPIWNQDLKQGKLVVVQDATALPVEAEAERRALEAREVKAHLAAPITDGEAGFMGFVGVDSTSSARQWSAKEQGLLKSFANSVGSILRSAENDQHLQSTVQTMEAILEASGLGFWTWDIAADIVSMDARMQSLLGGFLTAIPKTGSLGDLLKHIHPEDRPAVAQTLEQVRSGESDAYECAFRIRHPEGTFRHVHARGTTQDRNPDGRPSRVLGTLLDITGIERSKQEQVGSLKRSLEEKLFRLDHLAQSIPELRTSINGISGMMQLLDSENLQEGNRQFLGSIQESLREMQKSVDDLISFSTLSTGRIPLNNKVFASLDYLGEIVQCAGQMVAGKDLKLETGISTTFPRVIQADLSRLMQLARIFLDNAVKFTPAGSVRISLKGNAMGTNQFNLILEVRDTGIGFPKDVQARVASPPEIAGDNLARGTTGLGLGLLIAHDLVQAMGGHIFIESQPGTGTLSRFEVPVLVDDWRPVGDSRENKAVLVVEDNIMNQRLIMHLLEDQACSLVAVKNGQEALDWMRQNRADLILLDIKMPVMDGRTFLQELARERKAGELYDVPIVVISAVAEDPNPAQFNGFPVKAVLPKPFVIQEFNTIVSRFLNLPVGSRG